MPRRHVAQSLSSLVRQTETNHNLTQFDPLWLCCAPVCFPLWLSALVCFPLSVCEGMNVDGKATWNLLVNEKVMR